MTQIKFIKNNLKSIDVPIGSNLMKSLISSGIPVASSCGGDGICTKCRVKVIEGAHHLSPPNELEIRMHRDKHIPFTERLACQTEIRGSVTVDADYW